MSPRLCLPDQGRNGGRIEQDSTGSLLPGPHTRPGGAKVTRVLVSRPLPQSTKALGWLYIVQHGVHSHTWVAAGHFHLVRLVEWFCEWHYSHRPAGGPRTPSVDRQSHVRPRRECDSAWQRRLCGPATVQRGREQDRQQVPVGGSTVETAEQWLQGLGTSQCRRRGALGTAVAAHGCAPTRPSDGDSYLVLLHTRRQPHFFVSTPYSGPRGVQAWSEPALTAGHGLAREVPRAGAVCTGDAAVIHNRVTHVPSPSGAL